MRKKSAPPDDVFFFLRLRPASTARNHGQNTEQSSILPSYILLRVLTSPSPHTGTTYSCVAIYEGSNVEIIANEQGSFTTPSFVSFTDKERLIGEAAKNNAAMNPRNTVFDAK